MKNNIPDFKNEDAEREFFGAENASDNFDWANAKKAKFPKLKPSLRTISLRLPEMLIHDIQVLANKKDVPYQSLMKIFLAERVQSEAKL
jgi:predicted DNA binding CopG/RHH family protein